MVTVTSEGAPTIVNGNALFETPTFCRADADAKINREICPVDETSNTRTVDPVVDVTPQNFGVRFVFSELLDPDVETLEDRDENGLLEGHIDTTNPLTIVCDGVTATYDGYYQPSGNDVSTEPGPSIAATIIGFPAATGSACTATVENTVVDKENNPVTDTTLAGPHAFTLANLHLSATDPAQTLDADGMVIATTGVDPTSPLALIFNAPVDVATIDTTDVTLVDSTDTPVAFTIADGGEGAILVVPDAVLAENAEFTLTFLAAADIADTSTSGGVFDPEADDVVVLFETGEIPPPAP